MWVHVCDYMLVLALFAASSATDGGQQDIRIGNSCDNPEIIHVRLTEHSMDSPPVPLVRSVRDVVVDCGMTMTEMPVADSEQFGALIRDKF